MANPEITADDDRIGLDGFSMDAPALGFNFKLPVFLVQGTGLLRFAELRTKCYRLENTCSDENQESGDKHSNGTFSFRGFHPFNAAV